MTESMSEPVVGLKGQEGLSERESLLKKFTWILNGVTVCNKPGLYLPLHGELAGSVGSLKRWSPVSALMRTV